MDEGPVAAAKRLLPMYEEKLVPWTDAVAPQSSCRKGCSQCCRQLVGSTLAEGVLIASHIRESAELHGDEPEIRRTLVRQLRIIQGLQGEAPDEYMAAGGPCAFLDRASGECRVYGSRPTACRLYYVRSDPSLCGRPGKKVDVIHATSLLTGFEEEVRAGTSDSVPPVSGAMQAMVLLAFEMLDRPREEFDRMIGMGYEPL